MSDIRIIEDWQELPWDLPALTAKLGELLLDLRDDLKVTEEDLVKALDARQTRHFFALNREDQLVGYADLHWWHAVTGSGGYIHLVVVRKDEQQKGIGTLLGNAFMDAARTLKLPEFHLHTGAWRTGAQALYKSLGFYRKDTTVLVRELP